MIALHIDNNIIDNIIVVNAITDVPGCIAYIDGAKIGDSVIDGVLVPYVAPETSEQKQIRTLTAQLGAAVDRADFLDECIAEMAAVIYA